MNEKADDREEDIYGGGGADLLRGAKESFFQEMSLDLTLKISSK